MATATGCSTSSPAPGRSAAALSKKARRSRRPTSAATATTRPELISWRQLDAGADRPDHETAAIEIDRQTQHRRLLLRLVRMTGEQIAEQRAEAQQARINPVMLHDGFEAAALGLEMAVHPMLGVK